MDALLQHFSAGLYAVGPNRFQFLRDSVPTKTIDPQESLTVGKLDSSAFFSLTHRAERYASLLQESLLPSYKDATTEGQQNGSKKKEKPWEHSMLARNMFLELVLATSSGYESTGNMDEPPLLSREEAECALNCLFMVIGYGVDCGMELGEVIDSFLSGECGMNGMGGRRVWACVQQWEYSNAKFEERPIDWKSLKFGPPRSERMPGSSKKARRNARNRAALKLDDDDSYFAPNCRFPVKV